MKAKAQLINRTLFNRGSRKWSMPCTNPGQMMSPVTSNAYERDGTSSRCDVAGADAPKTRPIADRFCFFGEPHFLSGANEMNKYEENY